MKPAALRRLSIRPSARWPPLICINGGHPWLGVAVGSLRRATKKET
jgi:hypothetical protein